MLRTMADQPSARPAIPGESSIQYPRATTISRSRNIPDFPALACGPLTNNIWRHACSTPRCAKVGFFYYPTRRSKCQPVKNDPGDAAANVEQPHAGHAGDDSRAEQTAVPSPIVCFGQHTLVLRHPLMPKPEATYQRSQKTCSETLAANPHSIANSMALRGSVRSPQDPCGRPQR